MLVRNLMPERSSLVLRAIRIGALAIVAALVAGSGARAESVYSFATTPGRLPKNVVPTHYAIDLRPDLATRAVPGSEVVDIKVLAPTDRVVLNAVDMVMHSASLQGEPGQVAAITPDPKTQTVTLLFPHKLAIGPHRLVIAFTGRINRFGRGLFSVDYPTAHGQKRMIATELEPADARRVFPCWDEPAFKASFEPSVTVPQNTLAVSNMPIAREEPAGGGFKRVSFGATPRMSTYLFVLVAGDLERLTGDTNGVTVGVVTTAGKREQGRYALKSAIDLLGYYNDYFGVKYPLPKLDLIAVPGSVGGAMENWGGIVFNESILLFDPSSSPDALRRNIFGVLAHEMAHQWFGDLVTMQWWNDIWLNEGFATWMSAKPAESWKPEWHGEREEIQQTNEALTVDSIASVRPIRAKAETRAEIETLFDGIAYGKTASVLRMIEAYLGPEDFRKGVNAYLEKHAYGNATAEDFWNQMAASSGKPVDQIMPGFTQQPGAPLISVKSSCSQKKLGKFKKAWTTQVTLSQQRYFADASKLDSGSQELWQIPVNLRPDGAKDATYVLLAGRQQTFDLPGCADWVFANAGARGYYRTDYDPATLAKISAQLETGFSPEERIHFLGDVWAMVDVGHLSVGDYLVTLEKMKSERTRAVLDEMTSRFAALHDYVAAPADRPAFEKWVRDLLRPIANELGDSPVAGEPDERRALRADVFAALATYGRDPQLLAQSRTLVDQYMRAPNSVDAGLAGNALAVSALVGDANLYNQYLQQLKTAKTPEEYYNYLSALGEFPQAELAKRTFDFILSAEVKNQDLFYLGNTLANPDLHPAVWELLKTNYDSIMAKAGTELGSGIVQFAGAFCDEKLRDLARAHLFFAHQFAQLPGFDIRVEHFFHQFCQRGAPMPPPGVPAMKHPRPAKPPRARAANFC
jgi:aminopeptidase N